MDERAGCLPEETHFIVCCTTCNQRLARVESMVAELLESQRQVDRMYRQMIGGLTE